MRKTKRPEEEIPELSALAKAFFNYRSHHKGKKPHYPDELKRLVCLAYRNGESKAKLSLVTRLAPMTVQSWIQSEESKPQKPFVRELTVKQIDKVTCGRFLFHSGTVLEVPLVALTKELLEVLLQEQPRSAC
jgi:hypothetical protein